MKKGILILVFILVAQFGYKIIFAFAAESEPALINVTQQDQDSAAIKKVIESFLKSITERDLDSMMTQVSKNYSAKSKDGSATDYNRFKAYNERMLKDSVSISISNLNIIKLDISDNKATIVFKYNFKGFPLDTMKEIDTVHKREYSLIKENGFWKIVSYKRLLAD